MCHRWNAEMPRTEGGRESREMVNLTKLLMIHESLLFRFNSSTIPGSTSSKRTNMSSRRSGGATPENRQNYSGGPICLQCIFPHLHEIHPVCFISHRLLGRMSKFWENQWNTWYQFREMYGTVIDHILQFAIYKISDSNDLPNKQCAEVNWGTFFFVCTNS